MNPLIVIRGLAVMGALILAGYLLGDVLNQHWIDVYVRDRGLPGELLFLVVGGLLTAVGLPRQVVAFLGGYGFGFMLGTLLGLLAAVVGCIFAFYCARLLGRSLLVRKIPRRVEQLGGFIHDHTFSMTLLIRLLPVGSNLMLNLAAGMTRARSFQFFAGSALGYFPQVLVFSLIGSGTQVEQFWQIAIAIALFVASSALGVQLYRRFRQGRGLNAGPAYRPGEEGDPIGTELD